MLPFVPTVIVVNAVTVPPSVTTVKVVSLSFVTTRDNSSQADIHAERLGMVQSEFVTTSNDLISTSN